MKPNLILIQDLKDGMTVYGENPRYNHDRFDYDELVLDIQQDEPNGEPRVIQPPIKIHTYRVERTDDTLMLHSLDYFNMPPIDLNNDMQPALYATKEDVELAIHMHDGDLIVQLDTMSDGDFVRFLYDYWISTASVSPTVRLNMQSRVDAF